MQQVEPEISEKIDFGNRDKSKFKAPFGTFQPTGFCCKEENRHLFNLNVSSKIKFFSIKTSVGEIKPLLTEEKYSDIRCDSKLKTFSRFPVIIILMEESN